MYLLLTDFVNRNRKSCYAGANDPGIPYISPLFGELEGLPPLLIYAGGDETLLDDAVLFANKAERAGVDVKLRARTKIKEIGMPAGDILGYRWDDKRKSDDPSGFGVMKEEEKLFNTVQADALPPPFFTTAGRRTAACISH